jgi:hypothetical protein
MIKCLNSNAKPWLIIPSDGGPIIFTGNADKSAKEFFSAVVCERDGYIAALKAERDALAVENAALIEGLRCIYTTALIAQDAGPEILYSWDFANQPAEEIEMWISDAKETDVALAAIEARGVEKAIAHLLNKFEGTGQIGVPVMALESLAKQMREAK